MESEEATDQAKKFEAPADGEAGLYVYRDSTFGGALKKDVWVDGKCLGESAPNVFFHTTVQGEQLHTVSTESEFSPNSIRLLFEKGKNYFIRQYIKIGVFVGGANIEVIDEDKAKRAIAALDLAKPGTCSGTFEAAQAKKQPEDAKQETEIPPEGTPKS